jgi:hypothetical protein
VFRQQLINKKDSKHHQKIGEILKCKRGQGHKHAAQAYTKASTKQTNLILGAWLNEQRLAASAFKLGQTLIQTGNNG